MRDILIYGDVDEIVELGGVNNPHLCTAQCRLRDLCTYIYHSEQYIGDNMVDNFI